MSINKRWLVTIILMILLAAIIATSATFAYWADRADITQSLDVDIDDYNASEQYIIFYGLDDDGNFTDDEAAITAFAVVGYRGLVAELEIPATHKIHDTDEDDAAKPVTQIAVHPNYMQDRLSGNPIITSMVIPASVVRIATGVCQGMTSLTDVVFLKGAQTLTIEDLAFAGCINLNKDTFITKGKRTISESSSAESYLAGTPLISYE